MPPPSSTSHHRRYAPRFPAAPALARHRHLTLLHQSHLLSRLPALPHLPAPDISILPYFSRLRASAAAAAVTTSPDGAGLAARARGRRGERRARRLACTEGGSPVRTAGAGADGMLIGGEEGEAVYRRVWGRRTRGQRELWRRGEGYMLASREWVGVRLAWEEDGAGVGDGVVFAKREVGERRERSIWEDDAERMRGKMGSWWIADYESGDEAEEVARKSGGQLMGAEGGEESDDQIGADSGTAVETVLPPRKEEASWSGLKSQFDRGWHTQTKTAWGAAASSPTTPANAGKRSVSENWEAYPHTPSGGTECEYELNEDFYGALLSPLTSDIDSPDHKDRDNGRREEDPEPPISSPKHDQQPQPSGGDTTATQPHQPHKHDPNPLDSTLQTILRKNRHDKRKRRRYTLDPSPNRAAAKTSTKHFRKTDAMAADSAVSPTIQAIRAGQLPLSDSFQIDLRDDGQTDPFTEEETAEAGPGCSTDETDEMDKMLTSVWDAYVCGDEYARGRLVACLREVLDEQARLRLDGSS
ncbi:hypothetical protein GTA08_BOTSDO13590 [Neofusicoccum parvum]|uniref:Uncharacterized protein n=1 Tax=Neofusicoccum parvum TaxID=310453 RepID=A0ACB5RQ76_9PEZI|nr:hypothetical protein GTA08_BOTSDO13590 [Neofusicoccum parvum]